jgi:crotonobetainyl-CoA:carnitine CoA-transferase CaiB-like acyl-CoA transferase
LPISWTASPTNTPPQPRGTDEQEALVLAEYRVLDLSDERGALCGQLLADLGAQVIRIEPPGGSPMRHALPDELMWRVYARNCESLVLDLTTPADRARFDALAKDADLIVDNGAVDGIDLEAVRRAYPGLVRTSITPFGVDGPKADYHATDLIVQAASGTMAITGYQDSKPLRTGAVTAWSHAGAAAAGASLLALRHADRTGAGADVDIAAFEACTLAASFSLLTPFAGASPMGRVANAGGTAIPLIWPAQDGFVSMTLGFLGPMLGFAKNLLAWMRDAGFIDEALAGLDWPAYLASIRETGDRAKLVALNGAIGAFLKSHTKAELLEGALAHGALIVPVSTTHDLLASPQLASREFWWDADGMRMPGAFARFGAGPLELRNPAPALDASRPVAPRSRVRRAASAKAGALPLADVKVLDFSWVMAGPWATRVLADYGATIVKVESRTRLDLVRVLGPFYGDKVSPETSGSFASINAGKKSVEIDPGTPEGKATILELVDWADVVVESFSPKAMKKWGLDFAALAARKPGLVMLSTCLFGQTGPYAMMAGYGTMGAALGGLALPTGEPGREPCGPFGPYTDYVAPRFSVVALLAALHHRDRTGQGQHIDQSQAESAAHYLSLAVAQASTSDAFPDRLGNTDAAMCPHDVYPCAGTDQWVAIAVRHDSDWRALVAEIASPDLSGMAHADLAARRASGAAIDLAIARWTSSLGAIEVERRLQRAGVPAHVVTNAANVREDTLYAHREHFVQTRHRHLGEVYVESVGWRVSGLRPAVGAVPSLGGDGDWVMRQVLRRPTSN